MDVASISCGDVSSEVIAWPSECQDYAEFMRAAQERCANCVVEQNDCRGAHDDCGRTVKSFPVAEVKRAGNTCHNLICFEVPFCSQRNVEIVTVGSIIIIAESNATSGN